MVPFHLYKTNRQVKRYVWKHLKVTILGDMGMGDGPLRSIIKGECFDEKSVNSLKEYFSI